MKLFSRALLAALVLLLGACEDPLDRIQGEPGEDGNLYTGEVPNEETLDQGEAAGEGTQTEGTQTEGSGEHNEAGDAGEP